MIGPDQGSGPVGYEWECLLQKELIFEKSDLTTERWLRDVKAICRFRETAELGDMDECSQLADVHRYRISLYLIAKKGRRRTISARL